MEWRMINSIYDNEPDRYSDLRKGWMFDAKAKWIRGMLTDGGYRSVLDYWCGTGDLVAKIASETPDVQFVWYDINETYVAHANKTHGHLANLTFVSSLADVKDGQSDFLYVNDVIHHFPHESDFLATIGKMDWKRMFVLEPNQFNPYVAYMQATMPGERNFSQRAFQNGLGGMTNGIRTTEKGYVFAFPNSFQQLTKAMEAVESVLGKTKAFWWAVYYVIDRNQPWKSS